ALLQALVAAPIPTRQLAAHDVAGAIARGEGDSQFGPLLGQLAIGVDRRDVAPEVLLLVRRATLLAGLQLGLVVGQLAEVVELGTRLVRRRILGLRLGDRAQLVAGVEHFAVRREVLGARQMRVGSRREILRDLLGFTAFGVRERRRRKFLHLAPRIL